MSEKPIILFLHCCMKSLILVRTLRLSSKISRNHARSPLAWMLGSLDYQFWIWSHKACAGTITTFGMCSSDCCPIPVMSNVQSALYHITMVLLLRQLSDADSDGLRDDHVASLITHCEAVLAQLNEWSQVCPADFARGSNATLFFHFICVFVLLPLLRVRPQVESLFTANCRFLFEVSSSWPAATVMLQGLRAKACQMQFRLPHTFERYVVGATGVRRAEDVPISWVVSSNAGGRQGTSVTEHEPRRDHDELERLLSKWP